VDFAVAPARINLIGDHTDYNGGLVLPVTIDKFVVTAFRKNSRNELRAFSGAFNQRCTVRLADFDIASVEAEWLKFVLGAYIELRVAGVEVGGLDVWIETDVPFGAGLSSSAAFSLALLASFLKAYGKDLPVEKLARLAQKIEHKYIGAKCGLMDQYAIALNRENAALFLNCGTYEHETVPLPESDYCFVVVESGVSHKLADCDYNARRAECEGAVAKLKAGGVPVESLSGLRAETLPRAKELLTPVEMKRIKHVLKENIRVTRAVNAIREGDFEKLGALFNDSHVSLRDDYEASSPELDALVEIANSIDGVAGARMTGGGFGGSIVAVVKKDRVDAFGKEITARYKMNTSRDAHAFSFRIPGGLRVI